jgi:hypothetical protein
MPVPDCSGILIRRSSGGGSGYAGQTAYLLEYSRGLPRSARRASGRACRHRRLLGTVRYPPFSARQIGVAVPAHAEEDRSLRRTSLLLAEAVRRDGRPLSEHREISNYLFVTCRDFAMLAVSALRERGIPARLRAGFAGYFNPGIWEDHYLCEHCAGGSWTFLDAQLGPISRNGFRIQFDIANVPDSSFRTTASTWRAVRAGTLDAATCGLPYAGITGKWWIASSVLRDAAALTGIECLPWDDWGLAASFRTTQTVNDEQAQAIDALAEALEPAPRNRNEATEVLEHFRWAAPVAEELRSLKERI